MPIVDRGISSEYCTSSDKAQRLKDAANFLVETGFFSIHEVLVDDTENYDVVLKPKKIPHYFRMYSSSNTVYFQVGILDASGGFVSKQSRSKSLAGKPKLTFAYIGDFMFSFRMAYSSNVLTAAFAYATTEDGVKLSMSGVSTSANTDAGELRYDNEYNVTFLTRYAMDRITTVGDNVENVYTGLLTRPYPYDYIYLKDYNKVPDYTGCMVRVGVNFLVDGLMFEPKILWGGKYILYYLASPNILVTPRMKITIDGETYTPAFSEFLVEKLP